MADDFLSDDSTPTQLPTDRDLVKPIKEPAPPIENKRGKLVSKPNTTGLEQSNTALKLPSLEKMERELSENFFKAPSRTRDELGASLLSGSFERIRSKGAAFEKRWGAKDQQYLSTDRQAMRSGQIPSSVATAPRSPLYTGIVVSGHQAQLEHLRFAKAYQLPYMKRNLALAYMRTNLMKRLVGLTDQMRRELLAKLDTVKTNIAVPDAAKGTLVSKILEETRRQAIARVASSIQGIGFQYANKFYSKYVTKGATAIRDRLHSGDGLRDLISEGARSSTQDFLRRAALLREQERHFSSSTAFGRVSQNALRAARRAALASARLTGRFATGHKGSDFGGRILSPIADFTAQFNPFNKSIFTPLASTGTGDDLVETVDGSSGGSGKSPLFYAFTKWTKEYRLDQKVLRSILLGKSVDPKDLLRKGNLAADAMSEWGKGNKSNPEASPKSGGGGFFSRFKSSSQFKDVEKEIGNKLKEGGATTAAAGTLAAFLAEKKKALGEKLSPSDVAEAVHDIASGGSASTTSARKKARLLKLLGRKKLRSAKSSVLNTAVDKSDGTSSTLGALAEDAAATGSGYNKLQALAGVGMIAAPFVLRRFSKDTADKVEKVGNRKIADDLSTLANSRLGGAAESGLKFFAESQLGQTLHDHLQNVPFYKNVMSSAQKKSFLAHMLGRKRSSTLSKDLASLKGMDYKSLGKVGVGLVTGGAALSAAKYGYNLLRNGDTTASGNQLRTYFGVRGLTMSRLLDVLSSPEYSGVISDGERHRLSLGEPIHRVLSSRQIGDLSRIIRKNSDQISKRINSSALGGADAIGNFISRHVSPRMGDFTKGAGRTGIEETSKVLGSLTDNLRSLGLAVGITPKDNIFTRYRDGLRNINSEVKSGGGLFTSLFKSVFGKDQKTRSTNRAIFAGSAAVRLGASFLKRHLRSANRDRIIEEGIANRTPFEKAARVGLLTARNIFYNPDRYSRDEYRAHEADVADKKAARKKALAESRAAFKKSRAEAAQRRKDLIAKRDAEKARQKAIRKEENNPTLVSLLLSRLGMGPKPRANSWKELMKQRDAERRGPWYSWRRALGRSNLQGDDVHKYADKYGLFGGLMDAGAGFGNSLLGSLAGSALGLVGRGIGGTARFGGRMALRGFDAARTIGLHGAINAGKGILPMVGGGLRMAGGLLKGPLGIGLLAHEVDKGFAENTTGATRRVGTTAAKMAEYGAMGAFFGPWGIAIGAGVGALVANMDYVSKALHAVGNGAATVLSPFWRLTKAVARGAWDITKFTGDVIGSTWTTIFGKSAKRDKNGRVISLEKNGILGDFRTVFFGQKAKYAKDGQLIAPAKRSMFGVIHDGFTKTFFGDKFSNGSYKPGTSLVDQAWDGLKSGIAATGKYLYNLPSHLKSVLTHGFTSLFDGMKKMFSKGWDKIKGIGTSIKNGVTNTGKAIANAPHNAVVGAKNFVNKGISKAKSIKATLTKDAQFAYNHPFSALTDVATSSHLPGATPIVGVATASSKWMLNSVEMQIPDSPLRKYIRASLNLYGIDNDSLYEFIHQMEVDEEKVANGKLKQYNHDDLRWFAGKFGLDPKNDDSVNYFITWFNNRFLPMFSIIRQILTKYKLQMSNVLNSSNELMLAIARDVEVAAKQIPSSVSTLKPSVMAYKRQVQEVAKGAVTLNPTTINMPDNKSAVVGKPSDAKASGQGGSSSSSTSTTKPQGQTGGSGNAPAYKPNGMVMTPDMTPGNVTDQKEYKAAYQLLANEVKAVVDKDKSLQFTLWAESVQDGPQKTAHTFNTEYRAGETSKNFLSDIYQDRGQHFTENTVGDRIRAMRQLSSEEDFASSIGNGATPTMAQMGAAIGHPIYSLGNGTQARAPAPPKPEQMRRAVAMVRYLQSKYKVSLAFAAGMAANAMVESRLEPKTPGDNGQAYGLFQWHQDRQRGIAQHFHKPVQDMNANEQTDAAMWELQVGADPQSRNLLRDVGQSNDVGQVVDQFVNKYERPADRTGNVITRTAIAKQILAAAQNAPATNSNTISRAENDQKNATTSSGQQVADATGGGGGASGGKSGNQTPGTVNANVDHSPVVNALNAIHDTIKSQNSGGSASTTIPATAPQSGSVPAQGGTPQLVNINHITNTQPSNTGASSHQRAVDASMKQVSVLAGTPV